MTLPYVLRDAASDSTYSSTDTPTRLVIAALCLAKFSQRVLELGGCAGGTTQWLARMTALNYGALSVVESDPNHVPELEALARLYEAVTVYPTDALAALKAFPADYYDFVFVDDCRDEAHVAAEVEALKRVCRNGAIVCFHDIEAPSDYIGRLCVQAGGYLLPIGERGLGIWVVRK